MWIVCQHDREMIIPYFSARSKGPNCLKTNASLRSIVASQEVLSYQTVNELEATQATKIDRLSHVSGSWRIPMRQRRHGVPPYQKSETHPQTDLCPTPQYNIKSVQIDVTDWLQL